MSFNRKSFHHKLHATFRKCYFDKHIVITITFYISLIAAGS